MIVFICIFFIVSQDRWNWVRLVIAGIRSLPSAVKLNERSIKVIDHSHEPENMEFSIYRIPFKTAL